MAAHAPAFGVAGLSHLSHAQTDRIQRGDAPTAVMQAGPVRLGERHQVMVTAVRAMGEGDDVARTIGQAQADDIHIEAQGHIHVGREQQHMRQMQGAYLR